MVRCPTSLHQIFEIATGGRAVCKLLERDIQSDHIVPNLEGDLQSLSNGSSQLWRAVGENQESSFSACEVDNSA